MAARLGAVPHGTDLVVRANPAAATATSGELGKALDPLVHKVIGRIGGAQ
jgi:ribonuclease P protein component